MRRGGFTLLEVAVAVAVLATAGLALERLAVRSLATIDDDAGRARTLLAARAGLADAALHPPPPGESSWADADGVHTTRIVTPTAHPWLREVRIRTQRADGRDATELVEIVYAPAR